MGGNWPEECSLIIDTGFNGGGLRIHERLRKYLEYITSFYPNSTVAKTKAKLLTLAIGGHEGLDSTMGAAIRIWADGMSKPARVRLIQGKTELLSEWILVRIWI